MHTEGQASQDTTLLQQVWFLPASRLFGRSIPLLDLALQEHRVCYPPSNVLLPDCCLSMCRCHSQAEHRTGWGSICGSERQALPRDDGWSKRS